MGAVDITVMILVVEYVVKLVVDEMTTTVVCGSVVVDVTETGFVTILIVVLTGRVLVTVWTETTLVVKENVEVLDTVTRTFCVLVVVVGEGTVVRVVVVDMRLRVTVVVNALSSCQYLVANMSACERTRNILRGFAACDIEVKSSETRIKVSIKRARGIAVVERKTCILWGYYSYQSIYRASSSQAR